MKFDLSKWKTPDTFDSALFGSLPRSSGIYLLVHISEAGHSYKHEVMYIGQSVNLAERLRNHEIRKMLNKRCGYVHVYFRRCPKDRLRTRERKLIKELNPPFNLQHRERGL